MSWRGGACVAVVVALAGLCAAPPVFAASGEPRWSESERALVVHSTRVLLRIVLTTEALTTKWKAEVAPAECGGPVPTEGWKVINEGGEEKPNTTTTYVYLGTEDRGEAADGLIEARGLRPGTCYDARFSATNTASKVNGKGEPEPAVAVVPFKTLPVEPPEVPSNGVLEEGSPVFYPALPGTTATTTQWLAEVETNGAEAEYAFEYSLPEGGHAPAQGSSSWKGFGPTGEGSVTAEQEFANVEGSATGLSPETSYYIRLRLHNEKGTVFQTHWAAGDFANGVEEPFETGTLKPRADISIRNVTGVSAHLSASVDPHGSATSWRFEWAASEAGACPAASSGAWRAVPGGEGTVSQAQAEATPYSDGISVEVDLGGLSSSTSYCARVSAQNGAGTSELAVSSFETEGPPTASTFAVHRLVGESIEFLGTVNPQTESTTEEQVVTVIGAMGGTFTLSFQGQTTGPIAFDAPASGPGSVEEALRHLPGGEGSFGVEGVAGGPYTVLFVGGTSSQPLLLANGSGLSGLGAGVSVSESQRGGETTGVEDWFQYVSDKAFAAGGWSSPGESSRVNAGAGRSPHVVGVVVPGLAGGEGYHFRVLASSSLAPAPIVGDEQHLTVPAAPSAGEAGRCPNAVFRTGLSGLLPDCRAYEQLSPFQKGGAQEPFHYGTGIQTAAYVGEDGEHAVLEAEPVSYGTGTGSGQSPYLFSRGEQGWSMTAAAAQPETGVHLPTPELYSADLTKIAFASQYSTSGQALSPDFEFEVGPVGGPYTTVASVPRTPETPNISGSDQGWVAGNGDLSKLVLATADHELLGVETGTRSGNDLYEYTQSGGLRQLNVTGSGGEATTIGACGAQMVVATEDDDNRVSANGSRVLFEAEPGRSCSESRNLYMRVDGTETVDVGAYTFVAADPLDRALLLKNAAGELVGYDTETGTFEAEPAARKAEEAELALIGIRIQHAPQLDDAFARPRYTYWTPPRGDEVTGNEVYRYDAVEHLEECISCASPFDPDPKQSAYMDDVEGIPPVGGQLPEFTAASVDGRFAFFTTVAALVPGDIDGEIPAEYNGSRGGEHGEFLVFPGSDVSPSTDVYEWRAAGVDGCALVQGCVALITDGRGGYLNLLLGTADEGRDVFFYSRSALVPGDPASEGAIAEGNIYDARIDGGFPPPPPRPVECSGVECSPPPPPPADLTPSSFTFAGPGNLARPLAPPAPPPVTHAVKCHRGHRVVRRKCVRVVKRRVRRAGGGARRRVIRRKGRGKR